MPKAHHETETMPKPSLSELLAAAPAPHIEEDQAAKDQLAALQLAMLRIQQGAFQQQKRVIVAFEGFDAAGKGGVIRALTENLDPRGLAVWPIGVPSQDEQRTHWLYRFWVKLPHPGTTAIFDRSWYGRVLAERVQRLVPKSAWKRAYREINQFERELVDDGVELVKIFLAVSREEQLRRFEARLKDPYKGWKLTQADLDARAAWNQYVEATDDLLRKTSKKRAPWELIPADDKLHARLAVLRHVTTRLSHHRDWMETEAEKKRRRSLRRELSLLEGGRGTSQ
jgi:polyphosphate kinase 2 (PPK2 family)